MTRGRTGTTSEFQDVIPCSFDSRVSLLGQASRNSHLSFDSPIYQNQYISNRTCFREPFSWLSTPLVSSLSFPFLFFSK